jgi:outer membrane cobalamin receptor
MQSRQGVEIPNMIVPFVAAMLLAISGSFQIVDDRGAPISGATVIFHSADGATVRQTSDGSGHVATPSSFDATSVTVSARGFTTTDERLTPTETTIVLKTQTAVIGSVSVATGSARSLHQLAVPAASLDATALATTSAYTTSTLLRSLPGFDFVRDNASFTNYGDLRVSFSGAGEDRGLALADDVPAQDGFGGQVDWLAYPPSSLRSVELLRGPGAALYGADAIGGVLELHSFAPNTDWRALPDGSFELQDGTPHRSDAALNYRFALAPNLTASIATQTGHQAYYDLTPGYETKSDAEATASSTATRAQIRYAFGNSSLDLGGLYANDEQFEGRPNYSFARNLEQTDLHFATSTALTTFNVVAYNRDTDIFNTSDQAPTKPGVLRYTQEIPTRESGVAASWFLTQTNNQLAIRSDEKFVFGDSTQFGPTGALQSFGTGKQQYGGLAIEDTYDRGRFEFIGGLRGDVVTFFDGLASGKPTPDRADRVLSPRAAVRYDVTHGIALRASTGGGFREPFLNELLRGYQIGTVKYEANPNLTPERSANEGIGLDALVGSGRVALDFTNTDVHNAIEFVTISPTAQLRENVARTQTDGTTLTYTAPLARCTRVRAYVTSQYARITDGPLDDIGNRLQYVPSRSGDVALDSGSGALGYGADVGYAGPTFADDRNIEVLPSAVLIGAHITRPLGQGASLSIEGANLNGAHYLSSIDRYGPPPSIFVRLRFGLGPQTLRQPPSACP